MNVCEISRYRYTFVSDLQIKASMSLDSKMVGFGPLR